MKNYIFRLFIPLFTILLFFVVFAESSYAVNCAPPVSGNYTISASCSFANTVDGVDGGTGTTNTAVMTISTGVTLTVGSIANQTIGYGSITIQNGGSIIINKGVGASLKKAPIWAPDADNDGYPTTANPTQQISANQPASTRRRNLMSTLSTADCNDNNASVWQNLSGYTDADGDGYPASASPTSVCSGSSLPAGYISSLPAPVLGGSNIGPFSTVSQGQLPQALYEPTSLTVTISGTSYIYVLGGSSTSAQSTVYKATIDTSGNIGAFSTVSQGQLPQALDGHSTVTSTINGTTYIYVLGGNNGTSDQSTVYKATIDTSGNIGTFSTASQGQLPQINNGGFSSDTVAIGGTTYIYVLSRNNVISGGSTVYKATIDTSGNIGTFSTASQGQLPQILIYHASSIATISGTSYIYVLGGYNGTSNQSTVYKATIDTSGNIGTFSTASQGQLPQALYENASSTIVINGTTYIYVLGGVGADGSRQSTVYKATIDTGGNIGTFSTASQGQLPSGYTWFNTAPTVTVGAPGSYIYIAGGNNTSGTTNAVLNAPFGTNIDCYDSNANAKPGQTATFTTNRGDGSFDYNCDGDASGYNYTLQYQSYNNGSCVNQNLYSQSQETTAVTCGGSGLAQIGSFTFNGLIPVYTLASCGGSSYTPPGGTIYYNAVTATEACH